VSPNPGAGRRLADVEKDLAALNKDLAWEMSKAAVDAAGIIDPTPISDGISAAMSLAEGDFVGAGLSLISMVPYVGDAIGKTAKGAKAAAKIAKLQKKIAAAAAEIAALKKLEKAEEAAALAAKRAKKAPKKKPTPCSLCSIPKANKGVRAKKKGGGSYGKLKGKGGEVHHMPANSVSPLSRNKGPAVRMSEKDHRKTASWGNSREAKAYRKKQKKLIKEGKFKEAQRMDIDDVRSKFGNKYDDQIRKMQEYTDSLDPAELKRTRKRGRRRR
jgi:multidrug efflux pump subunit AcrA (membrane-fusion protein)